MKKLVTFDALMRALEHDLEDNERVRALDEGTTTALTYVGTDFMEPHQVPGWLLDELHDNGVIPETTREAVIVESYNSGFRGNGSAAEAVGEVRLPNGKVVPVVVYWHDPGIVAGSVEHVLALFD